MNWFSVGSWKIKTSSLTTLLAIRSEGFQPRKIWGERNTFDYIAVTERPTTNTCKKFTNDFKEKFRGEKKAARSIILNFTKKHCFLTFLPILFDLKQEFDHKSVQYCQCNSSIIQILVKIWDQFGEMNISSEFNHTA